MVPEWLQITLPFVSGGLGVAITLKVAMARLDTRQCFMEDQVGRNRAKLDHMVGDARCDQMRKECTARIEATCNEIKSKVDTMTMELRKMDRWMAKHNGD